MALPGICRKATKHYSLWLVFTSDGVRVGVVVGVIRATCRAYDLVKIENRGHTCKWNHKLNGIRVTRIRTFPLLPIPFMTPSSEN